MKSPVGSHKHMELIQLEDGLNAYKCTESQGYYIPAVSYMRWLSKQPARLPQQPDDGQSVTIIEDRGKALLCPETGTIMIRYKVGHGFHFSIDRSITGGIWLDKGEWEALRARNFHDEIHYIFTESWQKNAIREENEKNYKNRLYQELGDEFMSDLTQLQSVIMNHPQREKIIAYLIKE